MTHVVLLIQSEAGEGGAKALLCAVAKREAARLLLIREGFLYRASFCP